MRRHSTFIKLFLGNLLVMITILTLGGLIAYRQLNANYQQEAAQNQDRLAHFAMQHFRQMGVADHAEIDRTCKELFSNDPAVRLTVIASDGAVLGDSNADPRSMVNHKTDDRPEVLAALAGKSGSDTRRSGTLGVPFRYIALPLVREGQVVAAVRIAVPARTIADNQALLVRALAWAAVAGIAVAILLGLLVAWVWYAPLRRVAIAARQIAAGNLARKVRVPGGGELAALADSLNDMRENLRKQLELVISRGQDLQTILTTMREGVIATDAGGAIVLMNPSAGRLLSVDPQQASGQMLQSVATLELLDFHGKVLSAGKPMSIQLEMPLGGARHVLDVQGVASSGSSSIRCVLVMRDVTELATAAAMKTQFVANASHELRTPLATLRVAVDSLACVDLTDPQELKDLTAVLDRHVGRLEDMTNDLLDLHMVESAKVALRQEEMSLSELAHWLRQQFGKVAAAKELTLDVSLHGDVDHLRCDRKMLEMILRNLVDNAIKFTPAGRSVKCELQGTADKAIFRVIDTGCGIAPEDQSRVFERFFQSNASRSGQPKTRGTGLGLAIVKHAAERLGASIEMISDLRKGTTVTVAMPRSPASSKP